MKKIYNKLFEREINKIQTNSKIEAKKITSAIIFVEPSWQNINKENS